MADEPRYTDELRVPFSMSINWTGKRTPNGTPWPADAQGRYWSTRRGWPVYPIDRLPHGVAPGTNPMYRQLREKAEAHVAHAAAGSNTVVVTADAPPTASIPKKHSAARRALEELTQRITGVMVAEL